MRPPIRTAQIAMLAAVVTAALPLLACGPSEEPGGGSAARGPGARAVPVIVAQLEEREFIDTIEALGTALANESVVVSAQVTETVSRVLFEDGQLVEGGDVLVELTSIEESAQLEEARANFAEAKRQYLRTAELARGGTVSRALLDERTAARDAARARLDELTARMRDRRVRAPFRGVLGLRMVSPGTLLQPGDAITTLDDIDAIKVDFSVPERFLSVMAPGLPLRATAAAWPDERFVGSVTAVDTRVDPQTRAVRVRALVPNENHRLRPGMLLTVELTANPSRRLAIPEQAIVPVGNAQYVFVLEDEGRTRRVELETGRRRRGMVEVLAGLDGGETVVIEGGSVLQPGSLVKVVTREHRQEVAPPVAGS